VDNGAENLMGWFGEKRRRDQGRRRKKVIKIDTIRK